MASVAPVETLTMWTVYDRPTDHPDSFVARRWSIEAAGPKAEPLTLVASAIAPIRAVLDRGGFTRMPALPGDDPVILETWF